MKKLYRNVLFAGVLAIGVAACGDDVQVVEPTPTPPPALSVTLTPSNVTLDIGETVNLTAGITGGAAGETASWTCASAGSAITVANSASGCSVTAVADGNATVSVTVTKGTQTSSAGAAVTVRPEEVITEAQISIAAINQGGIPAQINNISGQLDVVINVTANDETPQRVDLLVDDEIVASQVMSTAAPAQSDEEAAEEVVQQITLSFNTAHYTIDNGVAMIRHLNGEHEISAQLTVVGLPEEPRASNTVLVNFNNMDGFHVQGTLPTNSAMDSQGRRWFGGPGSGSTNVTAIPVFYSGQTAQSVQVTFCTTASAQTTAPFSFNFACSNFESATPATGTNVTVTSQYAPDGSAGPTTILNADHPFPARIDNRAPQGGSIVIATQSSLMNRENWVNGQYAYATGYTTPTDGGVSATTFQISRDFRVTRLADAVIVQQGQTTAAGLAETITNQEYRLSVVVADLLDNSRTIQQSVNPNFTDVNGAAANSHSFTTFGFDGTAPTFTGNASDVTVQLWSTTVDLTSTDAVSGFAPPATGEGLRHLFVRVRGTPNQPTNLNREIIVGGGSVVATPFATSLVPAFIATPAGVMTYVRTPTQLEFSQTIDAALHGDIAAYYIYQAQARDKAGNLSSMYRARAYQNASSDPEVTGLTPATFYAGGEQIEFSAVASDPVELINASFDMRYAMVGRLVFDRNPTPLGTKFTDMITRPFGFNHVYRATFQSANIISGFIRNIEQTDEFGRPTSDLNKPNQAQSRVYNGFTGATTPRHHTTDAAGDGASTLFPAPILADAVEDGVAYPTGTAAANSQAIGPTDVADGEAADGGSFGFTIEQDGSTWRVRARGITNEFLNPFQTVIIVGRVNVDGGEEDWLLPIGVATFQGSLDNGIHRDWNWTYPNTGTGGVATTATAQGVTFSDVHAIGINSAWDGLISADLADAPVAEATTLTLVSGDGQSAAEGVDFADPLVVEVRDQFGFIIENASVTFAVTGGTGAGSVTSPHLTDAAGLASAIATATTAGTLEITADAGGTPTPVVFNLTVTVP